MCMILDANMWSNFLNKTEDMQPVHKWLRKHGKIVYSDHKSYKKELDKAPKLKKFLEDCYQSGQAKRIGEKKVEKAINSLKENKNIKSNDIHILGLVEASKVKVLCTKDRDLHQDFKKIIGGNIYQNKNHQKLLTKDTCP